MAAAGLLPLPRGWTKTARSSVLHPISSAFTVLTRAWGSSATSRRRTIRLQADLDRAQTEIALLNEELAIKDHRVGRVTQHFARRPCMRVNGYSVLVAFRPRAYQDPYQ